MASTTAQIAKDKGNASFKSGDYAQAVGHYSAAIVANRTEPTYPLNRAAAYLKLGKHRDAERDCTTVLGLDSKNVKALFRRAQARVALGSLVEAEQDLKHALRLEPANDSVKKELVDVQKLSREAARKQASSKREPITVSPLPSSPRLKSDDSPAPRPITRNVPIEIVEPDEPVADSTASSNDFLKPRKSRVLSPSPPDSQPKPQPRVGAAIFRADGKHTILRAPTSESRAPPPPSTSSAPSPALASPVASPPSTSPPHAPASPPPLTHFAFSRAWHALSTAHERYSLLRRIPPESLPALFQTSLEPELLVSILRAFEAAIASSTMTEITAYMNVIPTVPRFGTVILFLSPGEKSVVQSVWNKLGGNKAERMAWGI